MSTSRWIQLNDYILLEYSYTSASLPEQYSFNFSKIVNGHMNGSIQLLNPDNAVDVTGNVQERSAIQTSDGTFTDLDKDDVPTYLTYDTNLTVNTVNASNLAYDTVKFHLVSGYSFDDLDGVIAEISAKERSGKWLTLLSIRFLKDSDFFELNPRPIWLGDRVYDRFFEAKIPSIKIANDQYYSLEGHPGQSSTFVALITSDGGGFLRSNPLNVDVTEIKNTTTLKVGGARYDQYHIGSTKTVAINQSDEFSLLSAVIQPSSAGDYFEYFASWNGGFIEDFILSANALPENEYMVLHEIRVFEQVGSVFSQTDILQTIQEDNYDAPKKFRPVIENSDKAVSFTIEYTARLYNKMDSSQIIRISSYTSYDVKKWGKNLTKLKILNEPETYKIYNKVVDGPTIPQQAFIQTAQAVTPFTTKFVPSFFDRSMITVGQDTVYLDQNGQLQAQASTETSPVFGQGDLNIIINPFDNFFKFTIFKTDGTITPGPLDLGMNTLYYMVFINDSGIKQRYPNQGDIVIGDPSKGDLIFKIPESDSEKILKFNNKEFFIVSKTNDGSESLIYHGVFNSTKEVQTVKVNHDAIKANQATKVETKIVDVSDKIDTQQKQLEQTKTLTPSQQGIIQKAGIEIPGMATDVPSKAKTSIIASVIPVSEQTKSQATKATEKNLQQQAAQNNLGNG